MSDKQYLDLEGLKTYHNNISAKIEESSFSGDYEDLSNRPTIQTTSVDEISETLVIK